ncbi:TPA: DUF3800 domain-containing protein [Elizabethkingia anophelis]|nr:DUF3800 domain-containing protein [Elizabethkingia anophelis]MCT3727525.1 DUF3800 domain-containing protein [Elizabethkingia anophelis]MCT3824275.1 DUF3800 domain-containing protein [Elizabethkingia anophelis]MCT3932378.1 DUF3800 domain-containing protein [Elizabethkingia anophelis]MCT4113201.1 DUF3800 domain-containing protein [Elizabethkingia anophelis]
MNKTFNIYCDESCHIENDHKHFMFLGSVSSAYNQIRFHNRNIKEIKTKHNFFGEIKWSNVSKSKFHFYMDLVDYFFNTDLKFRCVGVEKCKVNNQAFNQTYDDFYYKMYYYLLNHNINSLYTYNVYLDIKDTLSAFKVNKLKNILNTKYGVFRNVQNIRSNESLLMQLTDFIMGAISYHNNNEDKQNTSKVRIIEKIINHAGSNLTSTNYSDKLNLFFIELK